MKKTAAELEKLILDEVIPDLVETSNKLFERVIELEGKLASATGGMPAFQHPELAIEHERRQGKMMQRMLEECFRVLREYTKEEIEARLTGKVA